MRPSKRPIDVSFDVAAFVTVSIFCELKTSVTFITSGKVCVRLRRQPTFACTLSDVALRVVSAPKRCAFRVKKSKSGRMVTAPTVSIKILVF